MLKPEYVCVYERTKNQPPSGGCVLKRVSKQRLYIRFPAAFGRLRVETAHLTNQFGHPRPAAFGRLRVETRTNSPYNAIGFSSRLRAAAC